MTVLTNKLNSYTGSTVCVAASNRNYEKAWFSNYGPNVFIIAPGENITAASNEKDNYEVTKSGTSMASPFVSRFLREKFLVCISE